MSKIILLAIIAATATDARAQISPQAMSGTWQIMSVKNLATGAVDSIAQRRTMWTQYTNTRWTYIWTDVNRRAQSRYEQVWNGANQVFWASGGEYWLTSRDMFYTNVLSISPWQLQIGSVEHVVS